MKVSELIQRLENYQKLFSDDEIEFRLILEEDEPTANLYLHEICDGYNESVTERVCEINLQGSVPAGE